MENVSFRVHAFGSKLHLRGDVILADRDFNRAADCRFVVVVEVSDHRIVLVIVQDAAFRLDSKKELYISREIYKVRRFECFRRTHSSNSREVSERLVARRNIQQQRGSLRSDCRYAASNRESEGCYSVSRTQHLSRYTDPQTLLHRERCFG